jgi:hypothetical protein
MQRVKIATILCWLFVPERMHIFSLASGNPRPIGCHCAGTAKYSLPVFGRRFAGLREGMTANVSAMRSAGLRGRHYQTTTSLRARQDARIYE